MTSVLLPALFFEIKISICRLRDFLVRNGLRRVRMLKYMKKTIALIFVFNFSLAIAHAGSSQVWFYPNGGSKDELNLFSKPDQWTNARNKIQVFGFNEFQLIADSSNDCAKTKCGDNFYENFMNVKAFSQLSAWGIKISIGGGAIKPWDCTASDRARLYIRKAIDRVEKGGGKVSYVDLDEPLFSAGEKCALSMDAAAAKTADFMRDIQTAYPSVGIGEDEPYPSFSAQTIKQWILALKASGAKPAFFHLDVNRAAAAKKIPDTMANDIRDLKAFFDQQGIPFGVIFFGLGRFDRDQDYYKDVMSWVNYVHSVIGRPEQIIFQSWCLSSSGSKDIPSNLPESGPNVYSHARIINDGLAVLQAE